MTFGKVETRKVTALQAGLAGALFGLGLAMCLAVFLVRRQRPTSGPVQKAPKEAQPVG